ncbi:hypothetical protein L1987_81859 [Smallanthus sonchifolius]|uniref:Uncharacterized protein n=1 Tax=Smallanthus sonchifolius TaxID=185202 RepID=A0ACB8YVW0_9ASTR|nr:hypothetical protein L1987_81859 [Smallanthus sonchifolius]
MLYLNFLSCLHIELWFLMACAVKFELASRLFKLSSFDFIRNGYTKLFSLVERHAIQDTKSSLSLVKVLCATCLNQV